MKILLKLMSENPFASIFYPISKDNSNMEVLNYCQTGRPASESEEIEVETYLD